MSLSAERREQVVALCQSLVQIPALSGEEKPVIDRVVAWMRELGYDHVNVDDCGNVVGVLHGGEGPAVIYDSHVDTVAPGDLSAWHHDPHSGVVEDGRLWGRGSTDMKGPLAACLCGLAYARQDGTLRGTALVSATVGEEVIEGVALSHVLQAHKPDLVVICEPTALRLNTAGRGRAEVTVQVHGKSAHASSPQYGVNALRQMAKLVVALDQITPPYDARLGYGILEPTEVITSPYPCVSVLPYLCRLRYDRRLLFGEDESAVLGPIQAVIARLAAEDSTFRAEASIDVGEFACYTGLTLEGQKFQHAWLTDSPFVAAAQSALTSAGQAGMLGHYRFCTNGSYAAGRAGLPTLGYGPGFEETAHITDEYLDLDQLFGATEGYYALGGMQVG